MLNWLEELGIHLVLSLLQSFVKNPAKKAVVRVQLLGLADDIYTSYELTPPTHD